MLITGATHSPAMSVETRRFMEQELRRDLERRRRRLERIDEAASEDEGGTMEW